MQRCQRDRGHECGNDRQDKCHQTGDEQVRAFAGWVEPHPDVGNDPNVERYDPDLWTDEFYFLNQPGQVEIQSDLFYDYRTNVDAYPKWQAWMREKQPRLLVIWGKYDLSFELGEPERYRKDVLKAEVHVLDAGHFALDTAADQIAQLVRDFMK